jgi:hypothetical protein
LGFSRFAQNVVALSVSIMKIKGSPMKKIMLIAVLAVALLKSPMASAQGTLYVSNLGQAPTGSAAIGSNSWVAQRIITGNDSSGYTLNSVQLLMGAASGSPGGFNVSFYSSNPANSQPGSNIGSLSGLDPSAGGTFTYTASDLTLSPSTDYYVVLTATASVAQGAYNWDWNTPGFTVGNNQWQIDDFSLNSPDGINWTFGARFEAFQLAVYATVIPEPATLALASLGMAALILWRRELR